MTAVGVLVSIRRAKGHKIFVKKMFSSFMGPTYITNWVLRAAEAEGLKPCEFEYQIGEGAGWGA